MTQTRPLTQGETHLSKNLSAVLIAFFIVVSCTVGLVWWDRGAPPGFNPTPHPTQIADVTRNHRGVRLKGTAHYVVRMTQTMEGGDNFWIFPLMEQSDTITRDIKVLVRTPRAPEDMVTFEDLTIDALVRPPGRLVTPDIREKFEERGYFFEEGFVLVEPFRIEG